MRVREFRLEDYRVVRKLWETSGLEIRPGDEPDEIKRKLERDPDLFLVAEEQGKIVGSVIGAWDGRRGWIYHLAVKPESQRTGVASALVKEVEDRLTTKGAMRVNAQVYTSNERSLAFFKAAGYEARSDIVMVGKPLRTAKD